MGDVLTTQKYSDPILRNFGGSWPRELLGLVCSDRLGSGMTREVFRFGPDEAYVIKFENESGHFQNVLEWEVWDRIKDTKLAKWFAPCLRISHCGRILIQRYAEPLAAICLPAEIPAFFTDLKPDNWGHIKGQPVAIDYGKTLMLERGMTSRMRKADWT